MLLRCVLPLAAVLAAAQPGTQFNPSFQPLAEIQHSLTCPSSGPLPLTGVILPASPACSGGEASYTRSFTFSANAGDQFAAQFSGQVTSGRPFVPYTYGKLTLSSPSGVRFADSGLSGPTPLLPESGVLTLPASGTWTLEVEVSSAGITASDARLSTVLTGRGCTPDTELDRRQFTGASLPSGGGSLSLRVGIQPGCSGAVTSDQGWLTASAGTLAVGFNPLTVTATRNYQLPRTATLNIGGTAFTLQQAGYDCTITAVPESTSAPSGYSSGRVIVTTSAPNCAWDAISSASWLQPYPLAGTGSAQVTYNVFPNFRASARHATLTVAGQPLVIQQAPSGLTTAQRYVQLLYFSFLGRMPSAEEIAFHVGSGQSREQLAQNFMNSAEFNQTGRFVAGVYLGLLRRPPDYGGWLFQRNALATGFVTQDGLVHNFLNSPEFAFRGGHLTTEGFIYVLYSYALEREATPEEVSWRVALLAGGMTRVALVRDVLNSAEFRQGINTRLLTFLLYATILQRDPSQIEKVYLEARLWPLRSLPEATRQAILRDEFIAQFVNGVEFNQSLQ